MAWKRLRCVNTIVDWERDAYLCIHQRPVLFLLVAFSTSTAGLPLKCNIFSYSSLCSVCPVLSVAFYAYDCVYCQVSPPPNAKNCSLALWRMFLDKSLFACNSRFTSKIPWPSFCQKQVDKNFWLLFQMTVLSQVCVLNIRTSRQRRPIGKWCDFSLSFTIMR